MSDDPPLPRINGPKIDEIDWAHVPLPSNRLTLGQLRQAIGCEHEELGVFVHNLALTEKEFAMAALREALNRPFGEDAANFDRVLKKGEAKELTGLYQEAGFGRHEAAEMIRELEAWAAAEARKYVPDRPR